ncbi:OprO/OprP family phosphate-selective porin [Thioalkalivibrio sp. XN279]|uniref:OprO/OprP family phosphate-selective porin n=1 Tax=Thioalkalivibrio sp. XN279 TaxID=2714953 RepID=UPI001F108737|nr:porin [Thioalkalivibrio sp. XN279]
MKQTTLRVALCTMLGAALAYYPAAAAAAPEFELRGRLHLDYGIHDNDELDLDDGFNVRRTRIGMQGVLTDDWSAVIEYDFAENETSAQDVVLRRNWRGGTLNIGHFKVPQGMEELSSTNTMPFIERPSPSNALVDGYRLGLGYDYFSGALGFQGMVYGRAIGDNEPGDDPIGIGARFMYAPQLDAGLLHLGLSVAYEDVRDYASARFSDRPEARADGNRLIDTGSISDVESTTKYGFEAAFQSGPVMVQGEYLGVGVGRSAGAEPDFSGWYVHGSWMLTGETRGYRGGRFRGITPGDPERGAWELALRYSSVDLNDSGFQGGEQDNVSVGVNYYANPNVRFMLNYIMVDVQDSAAAVDGQVVGDESPNILIARAAFHF